MANLLEEKNDFLYSKKRRRWKLETGKEETREM